jgi:hypothetical protein
VGGGLPGGTCGSPGLGYEVREEFVDARLTLASSFDLALVEEHDSLLVKLLLRVGVPGAIGALVLGLDFLLCHELAPDRR